MTNSLELPFPPQSLNPNARVHFREKARITKICRNDAHLSARAVKLKYSGAGVLTIVFHPPDKRKRDIDNQLASVKAYIDGICDYLEIDDSEIASIYIKRSEVVKNGKVVFEL